MKKLNIFFILTLLFVVVSCDPLEDLKEDYQEELKTYTYTLTDADYETIASELLYFNPNDSVNAEFIKNYKYFTDSISAAKYVPYLLDVNHSGKIVGTTFNVTVNYNQSMTDDLSEYVNAKMYVLKENDYSNSGFSNSYFTPGTNAENIIPTILSNNISTPSSGDSTIAVSYVLPNSADEATTLATDLDEQFSSNIGSFDTINIIGHESDQYWKVGNGVVRIEGWSEAYYDNEDWLITPEIDLGGTHDTKLLFENAVDDYVEGYILVLISEDFDGKNVDVATWNTIEVPQWETIAARPNGSYKDTYEESGIIDLSEYDGKNVYIAFKYMSDKAKSVAPFWSISFVQVGGYYWTYDDYYQYNGSAWQKLDNVHKITASEYDQFGSPGKDNYFAASIDPENYIPTLLEQMYPIAGEGFDSQYVLYNYYSETDGVVALADKYSKTSNGWASSYSFVTESTEPFKKATNGWVFDPTVIETMSKSDYQIIVDYSNKQKLNTHSYSENTDNYYGASGYYGNFDIEEDGSWNQKAFSSWEMAVETALRDVYLPTKYSGATAYSNGIEVFYVITFNTYNGIGNGEGTMTFKVTKDAPSPEFELVSFEKK